MQAVERRAPMQSSTMTPQQVHQWPPFALPDDGRTPLQRAQARAQRAGQWHESQYLGRRWAIGCVALEITQRCNLDCTLCYLSESSQALKDLPLAEIFRRIDLIHAHYGPGTDVQVTGGDPTLRDADELAQIVAYIQTRGMRSSLFTNGILANRDLLSRLANAGLTDVAFHVDMTQQRKGYASEAALNSLRERYIDAARGLPLRVFFNTTVFDGNFTEIPALVQFFIRHADVIKLASFQLQADSGRGVLHARGYAISTDSVQAQIDLGAGRELAFAAGTVGHHDCNRSAFALVVDGHVHNLLDDPDYARRLLNETLDVAVDRAHKWRTAWRFAAVGLRRPALLLRSIGYFGGLAWRMRHDLLAARGRVTNIGFFIHDFMDAKHLQCDRIEACSFMVMTAEGPLSMCVHNAKRDAYLLAPIAMNNADGNQWWSPVSGQLSADRPASLRVALDRKTARGRSRAALAGRSIPVEVVE